MDNAQPVIRFGAFEADVRSGELRKHGVKIRVGDQPFSVLAILLAAPGEVITRDDIQKRLWPADTFVDFDRGLNKAINRLRDALGDSAEAPRFIETLPKRGYRFIGTIESPPVRDDEGAEPAPQTDGSTPLPRAGSRRAVSQGVLIFVAAVLMLVALLAWRLTHRGANGEPVLPTLRSSLLPPPHSAFVPSGFALSPDGSRLAFVTETPDGSRLLWIRSMSATSGAAAVAGTDGASSPFWSPDQRRVGFFADRKLKVVEIGSGAIQVLADAPRATGGTWGASNVIVFAPDVNGPLYRVDASGGTPIAISRVPEGEGAQGHRWPVFLADGRHFIYVARTPRAPTDDRPELYVGTVDSADTSPIEWQGSRSAAVALGQLMYVHDGTLYAQPFDSSVLRTTGPPVAITGREVATPPTLYPSGFSVSMNGVLVFQSSAELPSELVWLDSRGKEEAPLAGIKYTNPAISPDGRLLAGSCEGEPSGVRSICVLDFARGVGARVTAGQNDRYPAWSRDGREIAYASEGAIYRVPADGSAPPERVSARGIPTGWLPDRRILSFGSRHSVVSMALSSPVTHEVSELWPGAEGQLSPDAEWLAYVGEGGLIVQRFPGSGARVIITGERAAQPKWSRSGRQIFYISADKKLMTVDFDPVSLHASAPRVVAQTRIVAAALTGFQYDVAPDGRFIVNALTKDPAPLTLLTGWQARLR